MHLPGLPSQPAKLVALFAALMAVLLLALAAWLPDRMQEQARRLFEARALDLARHAAGACGSALDLDDAAQAATVLGRLAQARGAAYAAVQRGGGDLLASVGEVPRGVLAPAPPRERVGYSGGLLHVRTPVAARSGREGALLAGFDLAELEALHAQARRHVVLACLAVFALGVAATFALGTVLARPLRKMARVADRIAAGELDAARELDLDAAGETGALSRTLAHMLNRLYEDQATIESLNAGLEHRVADRTAALEAANAALGERLAELKRTQEQLVVADRRVSIGRLAAGVAHEINNPLAFIEANLRFAAEELPALAALGRAPASERGSLESTVAELAEAIAESRQGADRVRHIVRGLKIFARTDEDRREPVDVREALEAALDMSAHELRHRARLERDLAPVPRVEGNAVRLSQVFLNLLMNAVQAIPEGAPEGLVRVSLHTDARGWVVAEVRDSGSGIPADVLPRIFDPFFTTKPPGVGTGLGLSISQGIVLALGGEIAVRSAPGEGATFRVALPPARCEAAPEAPPPAAPAATDRRRVLVVDDEPLVATAVQRALSRHHEVAVATSGREALELILDGARFDHILCDVMMPEMTGVDFRDALARADPGQARRVVFMTGGAFTPGARAFLERHDGPWLEKPLDLDALRRLLHGNP